MSAVLAMQKNNSELESVRWLLREWVRWRKNWRPHNLGYPGQVPFLHQIRATVDTTSEPDDYDEKIETHQMRSLDKAMRSLSKAHRHAIFVWYLREEGPAVWRSGRLPMQELRRLTHEAEVALIPILRRLDVFL